MKTQKNFLLQTPGEEIANAVSHGIGALASLAGMILLIVLSAKQGNLATMICGLIYGLSLLILYTSSTLYHALTAPKAKRIFRILDHCNIFLLITGTYAPISVLMIGGRLGYGLLIANSACGILGILLNAINMKKFKAVSMVLYILMGWMCIFIAKPLMQAVPVNLLWLLLGGGIAYTVGIVFYALKKPKFMHFIWHIFVLAGSILQFVFILLGCYY